MNKDKVHRTKYEYKYGLETHHNCILFMFLNLFFFLTLFINTIIQCLDFQHFQENLTLASYSWFYGLSLVICVFFIDCLTLFPDVVNIFLLGLAAVLMHSKMLRTPSCGFGSLWGLGKPNPTVHEWSMNPQTCRPWDGHVFDCLSAWQRQTGIPFLLSLCLNVTYCKPLKCYKSQDTNSENQVCHMRTVFI